MKVSFVIPSHNCAAWLPHAVESVLTQTHEDVECVIVNDGSTDSTEKYLNWLKDKRVRVIRNVKPLGRSSARNQGNALATGDILCVLDADDIAVPNRAKWMVEKFSQGAEFVYGSAIAIDAVGENLGEFRAEPFDFSKSLERKSNGIVHSTVAYTKELATKFPYRDGPPSDLGMDDWAQQVEIASHGFKLVAEPKIVGAYRVISTSVSNTRDNEAVSKAKDEFLKTLRVEA
jgi:glycosyltransferase involved in cell wall biosynthesis